MNKESILDYIDKGHKGYMSVCDLGRIIIDGICWFGILILFIIPGLCITKPDQIYSIYLVINIIISWICLIVYIIIMFILMGVIGMCYNKFKCKTKLCKIKLIKLR